MNEEMKKLRTLLDAENIEWEDKSDNNSICPLCRTHFSYNGQRWSVIHGYGSYGGYSAFSPDRGLLEAYNFNDEPMGYLTAEEVMQYVKGAGDGSC